MLYGHIDKGNSVVNFYITVSGYPSRGYAFYSLKEAKRLYRDEFGLVGKHIYFEDWRR